MVVTCYADGACKGNPGPMYAKYLVLNEDGETLREVCQPLGHGTNNKAEYLALLILLRELETLNPSDARIFGDSKLVIEQVNKRWKINDETQKILAGKAQTILERHNGWTLTWIPREQNRADTIAETSIPEFQVYGVLPTQMMTHISDLKSLDAESWAELVKQNKGYTRLFAISRAGETVQDTNSKLNSKNRLSGRGSSQ